MPDRSEIRPLSKLCEYLKGQIGKALPKQYWIKAQIAKISESRGIWYVDLVEPIPGSVYPYKMTGKIFSDKYKNITSKLGTELTSDVEIIFLCKVNYDGRFGMQLLILDAENELTALEQEKERVLELLKKEGILENNKKLEILLPH